MLRLYSPKRAEARIARKAGTVEELASRYPLPAAVLRAVLYKELTEIDVLDLAADFAVGFYWQRWLFGKKLQRLGLLRREPPLLRRGVFGKHDSSTGDAQIFAKVAINACNFALDRGLTTPERLGLSPDRRPDPEWAEDLRAFWVRLHRDPAFDLETAALNLLSAGEEMTGRLDFPGYTPEELKLVLTRYNANTKQITPYGEAAYEACLRYREKEEAYTAP